MSVATLATPTRTLPARETVAARTLLICGVLSSLLYVAMVALVPLAWPGYDSASQVVSELSAIDAPTRQLWVPLVTVYSLLLAAFGWGVRAAAPRGGPLRVAGLLVIVHGVIGLFWPPMHLRVVLAAGGGTLTDTLHIAWSVMTAILMTAAIGFAAAGLGTRFRAYSTVTVLVLVTFGWLTGVAGPRVSANLPTPLLGVWERVSIGAFLLWVVVLAAALLRRPSSVKPDRV